MKTKIYNFTDFIKGKEYKINDTYEIAWHFLYKKPMTIFRLQKLCYYAQAIHYAMYNKPLMNTTFIATKNGASSKDIFMYYEKWGYYEIAKKSYDIDSLSFEPLDTAFPSL